MPWYGGAPLLYHLEHVVIAPDRNLADVRFPVQWVIQPVGVSHHDYRGYAGQIAGGVLRPGDEVVVLPGRPADAGGRRSTRSPAARGAFPTMSVAVRLERRDRHFPRRHGRRGRGPARQRPGARRDGLLDERAAAAPRGRYSIKHTTRSARAVVEELEYRVDINTLEHVPAAQLGLNDIGRVRLAPARR